MPCLVCGSFIDLHGCSLASCCIVVAQALTSGLPPTPESLSVPQFPCLSDVDDAPVTERAVNEIL